MKTVLVAAKKIVDLRIEHPREAGLAPVI